MGYEAPRNFSAYLRERRRRLAWKFRTTFRREIRFQYDNDCWLTSPTNNFSTKKTFVYGYRDPEVFRWLDDYLKPGMTVFDVGANVGVYSVFLAKRVSTGGCCHAFEANPALGKYLEVNKDQNGLEHLCNNFCAVGDEEGSIEFIENTTNLGMSYVGTGAERGIPVTIVRLDDYARQRGIESFDFLKIDIEGFELQALRGFRETLTASKSGIVFMEVEPRHLHRYGTSPMDVADFMASIRYRPHKLDSNDLVPGVVDGLKDVFWCGPDYVPIDK